MTATPPEYEPLNLESVANAGAEALPSLDDSADVLWHGIPFRLGRHESEVPYAIKLTPESGTLAIPVEQTAIRWLLFAHVLVDAPREAADTLGKPAAFYVFEFDGGETIEIPIRDRFEIGGSSPVGADPVTVSWGHLPFAAVPTDKDQTPPRHEGLWSDAGGRQTETVHTWRAPLFLWPWHNPYPDRALTRVSLRPTDRQLLLCAVTIGYLEESPFPREAARELLLTLAEAEAGRPFALDVDVDRGSAGYPFLLSATSQEQFLADPLSGFGDQPNEGGSPAYVRVSATPSATVRISRESEELASARWGAIEAAGAKGIASGPVRMEIVDRGRSWVRTTVVDDATGQPLPCRIHFRSREGIPFAPHGHHAHVNSDLDTWNFDVGGDLRLGQATYAYISGVCEGWLPIGDVTVDVARGFEYRPLRDVVRVEQGQRELELRLERIDDLSREHWFSGDTHVHFLSTQGSHLEAAGEGLHVVNLLLAQWGSLFTETEEFTGGASVSSDGATIVYASQENRQHVLGHLSLLGLRQPVYPWSSDGPDEGFIGDALETTLSHWADACRAQGGTVVIPHFPAPNGEPAALIATGRADAVEMVVHSDYGLAEYYRYLNAGYRLPLAGGTDKMTSDVPVGLFRTFVHVPDGELDYDAWCRSLREGATFISSGPLLRFAVEGQAPGSEVQLGRHGGSIEISASVRSIFPVESLEIVRGGEIVLQVSGGKGSFELNLHDHIEVGEDTWLAARCTGWSENGIAKHRDCWQRGVMAHTSPVYLRRGERYDVFDAGAVEYMLTLVDGGLTYIRQRARSYHEPVAHAHGQDDHSAYLERPFHEAADALHRLLHAHGIPH